MVSILWLFRCVYRDNFASFCTKNVIDLWQKNGRESFEMKSQHVRCEKIWLLIWTGLNRMNRWKVAHSSAIYEHLKARILVVVTSLFCWAAIAYRYGQMQKTFASKISMCRQHYRAVGQSNSQRWDVTNTSRVNPFLGARVRDDFWFTEGLIL